MKAALGFCSAVYVDRPGKQNGEVCMTIRLPVESFDQAKEIFRRQRVLVTLADNDLQHEPDGIKTGKYRAGIPTLTDVVQPGE